MIDFRRKENVPASLLAVVAILVLLGTFLFMILVKPPTTAGLAEKTRREAIKIRIKTKDAEDRLVAAKATVNSTTWPGIGDDVAPAANARLTTMAARRGVKLTSFRPQRTTAKTDLTVLPFVITVEGPFPQVVELTRDIDTAGSRMAVNLIQVTAAADDSNTVSATVAVMAYLRPGQVTPAPSRTAKETTSEVKTNRA
jgi:hypothetical protein